MGEDMVVLQGEGEPGKLSIVHAQVGEAATVAQVAQTQVGLGRRTQGAGKHKEAWEGGCWWVRAKGVSTGRLEKESKG